MADELETRVAVLEVKSDVQSEKFDKIEESLKETHGMVFSIKERLDKQNGIIPHMAEDMKVIKKHYEIVSKEQTDSGIKLKILWGVLGALGGSLLSLVIKLLIG